MGFLKFTGPDISVRFIFSGLQEVHLIRKSPGSMCHDFLSFNKDNPRFVKVNSIIKNYFQQPDKLNYRPMHSLPGILVYDFSGFLLLNRKKSKR